MAQTRRCTTILLELLESGILSWENVCRECLREMSEQDVADMSYKLEWLDHPENM